VRAVLSVTGPAGLWVLKGGYVAWVARDVMTDPMDSDEQLLFGALMGWVPAMNNLGVLSGAGVDLWAT
jgi:hypothetical protein